MKAVKLILFLLVITGFVYQYRKLIFVYHTTLGRKQYYEQRYDIALDHYTRADSYGFKDLQFILEYSDLLKKNNDLRASLKNLQKTSSILLAPDLELELGQAFLEIENFDSAIVHYENAYYLSPSKFRPLYRLAKLYSKQRNFLKADSIATIIIHKEPKINSPEIIMMKEEMKINRTLWIENDQGH